MRHRLTILTLLALGAVFTLGQSHTPQLSPKEIVQKFWEIEVGGGVLTLEGWREVGGRFFVRPNLHPYGGRILLFQTGA